MLTSSPTATLFMAAPFLWASRRAEGITAVRAPALENGRTPAAG